MESRLPAHLEISGLIRAVNAAGGFGTVIKKGERDAGTFLVLCCENGTNGHLYERMPQPDGARKWTLVRSQDPENPQELSEYCARRGKQDDDLWIVELDIKDGETFLTGNPP
jgi:hypothetical protein